MDWSEWVADGLSRGCTKRQLWDVMYGRIGKEAWRYLDYRPRAVNATVRVGDVSLVSGVLSEVECDVLIGLSYRKGFNRNTVVNSEGGDKVDEARTSDGTSFGKQENGVIREMENRLSWLTGWPPENGEGLQVLKYRVGDEYRPHVDWFDDSPGGLTYKTMGGQRYGTVVVYLQCADEGGGTSFPKMGLTVTPRRGDVICFANVDSKGDPTDMVTHSGDPVIRGEKIVMTLWQRESVFVRGNRDQGGG